MAKRPPIKIKPSKEGTFTAAAHKAGKSLSKEASDVLKEGSGASTKLKRKAAFYENIVQH